MCLVTLFKQYAVRHGVLIKMMIKREISKQLFYILHDRVT